MWSFGNPILLKTEISLSFLLPETSRISKFECWPGVKPFKEIKLGQFLTLSVFRVAGSLSSCRSVITLSFFKEKYVMLLQEAICPNPSTCPSIFKLSRLEANWIPLISIVSDSDTEMLNENSPSISFWVITASGALSLPKDLLTTATNFVSHVLESIHSGVDRLFCSAAKAGTVSILMVITNANKILKKFPWDFFINISSLSIFDFGIESTIVVLLL